MISASVSHLRGKGFEIVDLLYGSDWPLDARVDNRIGAERYFYEASELQFCRLIARIASYTHVYFIGADVIDGAYNPGSVRRRVALLGEAASLGRTARILGCSYNEEPEATTRDAIRNLPLGVDVCARDPRSFKRLQSQFGPRVKQTADLAFMLEPMPDDELTVDTWRWIEDRRAAGDKVVALNANYLHAAKHPGIRPALTALIGFLTAKDVSVLLVPHDSRTDESDEKLLQTATLPLLSSVSAKIRLLSTKNPGVVKSVLSKVDLLATGRLHAQILAMGTGTPAFGFAYQGKFEGLLELFDLDAAELLSTPLELSEAPETVANKVLNLLTDTDRLRAQIRSYLPKVMALSEANFA